MACGGGEARQGVIAPQDSPAISEAAAAAPAPAPALAPALDEEFAETSFVLTPLRPEHTALDYQSVMENRGYLRGVMGWGDWPADSLTMEEDRAALQNHFREFQDKEAYAFAVLSPDRKAILGCVYINPESKGSSRVTLQYWVVEKSLIAELDKEVLATVLRLFPRWGIASASLPVQVANARGLSVASALGLTRDASSETDSSTVLQWRSKP
jgi:hypothetical protein